MPGGWCREIRNLTGEPDSPEVLLKEIARFPGELTDLEDLSAHPVIMPRGRFPDKRKARINSGRSDGV